MGGPHAGPAPTAPTPLGERLRALRQAAGLTQEELAERAGVTAHAVSALERGTRTRPHPHTLRSLAHALHASDRDLALLRAAVPPPGARPAVGAPTVHVAAAGRTGGAPGPTPGGRAAPAVDSAVAEQRPVVPESPVLVGRARELDTLAGMVRRRETPVVTLTGAGGVGKTQLAVAVANALFEDFPDGVSYVPLAALSDPALVVPTVGRALGLADLDPGDAQAGVAAHLRPLRHLLVLDNFEHLTAAAPQVAALAAGCPGLAVLVTSRASLRVRGETEFPVQPLALPTERDPGVTALVASPAGELFTARARAVSPGFAVTGDNVAAVAAICRRLAGIPLALELAAARLRYLEPETLLTRLDDAMARDGARDLPARQRTMRATIDWSYQLLDPAEQQLFRQLSVFTGGFTLDAAEHIADSPSPDRSVEGADVLGLLEALVEQSLVLVTRHGGHLRYGMLEPIAQYARHLLDHTDDAPRVHAAHAAFYLDLAERAAPRYQRAEQLDWLARMDPETANTTLAIERSLDHDDPGTAARLCWALWLFWWLRGHLLLGRRLTDATLTHDRLAGPARARTLAAAGAMAFALGDMPAAGRHWQGAFDLGMTTGDRTVAAHTLPGVGVVDLAIGELDAAEAALTQALPLAADVGAEAEWAAGLAHIWLGTVRMLRRDRVAAIASIEHGLTSARRRGDRLTSYIALYNLAQAALTEGHHQRARTHLREGIELSRQTRDVANLAYFFELLAVVHATDRAAKAVECATANAADGAVEEAGHEAALESADDAVHLGAARVATLLGAAQTMREAAGAAVYGYYRPDEALTQQAAGQARAALGADAYDDLVDTGRALGLDEAVAYALEIARAPAATTA